MIDIAKIKEEHLNHADNFCKEVVAVHEAIVLSSKDIWLNSLSITLYGYMMNVFSRIDLLSSYWQGNDSHQTPRMISFMDKYFHTEHEENSLAIQLWRHKLMHTSQPRYLIDSNDISYIYLLHWGSALPKDQHFTLTKSSSSVKLNLAVIYVIEDLREATKEYLFDLETSNDLQAKYEQYQLALDTFHYKHY